MKNSQVYFTYRYQIQHYDYNTTEESHEFRFWNLLSFDTRLKHCDVDVSRHNQWSKRITIQHNKKIKVILT